MPEKKYSTYALIDPVTTKVRYVGMTSNLKQRYHQHLKKQAWIRELVERGKAPILDIMDMDVDYETAKKREEYWIHKYEGEGHALENIVYNETALRQRQEDAEQLERLEKKYSYLPEHQMQSIIEITLGAYAHVGVCAWEDTFSTALFTAHELEKDGMLKMPVDEVEIAMLTLRGWNLSWNKEDEYGRGKEASHD